MSIEIENLQHMSSTRDIVHSLADKRERQYSQLGDLSQQKSLERAVRIGEVMDRTLGRWQRLTEKAEELDQNISVETERVSNLIQRLGDLGVRNPALKTTFETYKAEFDQWQGSQLPTSSENDPASTEEVEPHEGINEEGSGIIIDKVPVELLLDRAIGETQSPQDTRSTEIPTRKEAYILPDGSEFWTTQTRLQMLEVLEKGPAGMNQLMEATGKEPGWISSTIYQLDNQLRPYGLRIYNLSEAKQYGARYVWQYEGEEEDVLQVPGEPGEVSETIQEEETLTIPESEFLQIPQIPELRRIESANPHKYDETLTVTYQLEQARSIGASNRTPEQQQLLEDVEYLKKFTSSTHYQNVYSPEELQGLVLKLRTLENKDRESFTEVEERLIGHLIQIEKSTSTKYESPKKSSSSWITLKSRAKRVTSYLQAKYGERSEQSRYFMVLKDPNPNKAPRDLSSIYTFVAFDYAINLIGERTVNVTEQRYVNFEANCETINRWYQTAKPLIDRIPSHLKLPTGYTEHQTMVGARWFLCDLVNTMNIRLKGNGENRFEGFDKYYKYDSAGAIRLQYRIKHTVKEINEMLTHITTEEIVPLETE